MGHFGKKGKDDTYEWVTWQWANAKTKQQSPYIAMKRMNPKSIKTSGKILSFGNVQT
jgi:hypothetical protein